MAAGFLSAAAVALMGAVNAVATVAALGVALLWWLLTVRRAGMRAVVRPLVGIGAGAGVRLVDPAAADDVAGQPPFLDFIESSRTTTQWSSLTEVLRGTSAWTPFVSPGGWRGGAGDTARGGPGDRGARRGGSGRADYARDARPRQTRHDPAHGTAGDVRRLRGALGSPIAESVREFLDGAGAPLRNIHKFEPFVRIPVVLGIAHLLARVPLSDPRAFLRPTMSRGSAAAPRIGRCRRRVGVVDVDGAARARRHLSVDAVVLDAGRRLA